MNWVLLRGLTREARHWGDLPQRLEQLTGVDQVIPLDLPGNGAFCAQASPCTVPAMVAFARGQLLAQGLEPPYSLLAMSLGGMVASAWAQQYPHEVSRLVLINTSMRPYSGISARLRPGSWLPLLLLAARWQDTDYAEHVIHQLTCNNTARRAADLAAWASIRRRAPVSAANAWRQLWAAARFCSAAAPPPCPALVLSSASDQLVHSQCSAHLAQAWQAEHHEHPWAGHDLPHDDAGWVCQHLADWLDTR